MQRSAARLFALLFALASGPAVTSCSSSSAPATSEKCTNGAPLDCVCADSVVGVQICQDDGTYTACACSGMPTDPLPGTPDAGSGDGTSSGGSHPDAATGEGDGGTSEDSGTNDTGAGGGPDGSVGMDSSTTGADSGTGADTGSGADTGPSGDAGTDDAAPPFNGCDPMSSEAIEADQYIVQTDEWNSTLPQCISVTAAGFVVTEASFDLTTEGPPASYPSIYTGCHWGNCTDASMNGMPVAVASLPAVTSSWSTTQPATGAYDVAYDIWFNQTPTTTGQPDGAELMIWISELGATPAGTLIGVADLAGSSWNVWETSMASWTYIAYEQIPTTTSVSGLDIRSFIDDAVARGAIDPSFYLIDIEAGFEIWQGGTGLATNSFSVEVGGTTEECAAPTSGGLALTADSYQSSLGLGGYCYSFSDGTSCSLCGASTACLATATLCGAGVSAAASATSFGGGIGCNVDQAPVTAGDPDPVAEDTLLTGSGINYALSNLPSGDDAVYLIVNDAGTDYYCSILSTIGTCYWFDFASGGIGLAGPPDASHVNVTVASGDGVESWDFCVTALSIAP